MSHQQQGCKSGTSSNGMTAVVVVKTVAAATAMAAAGVMTLASEAGSGLHGQGSKKQG